MVEIGERKDTYNRAEALDQAIRRAHDYFLKARYREGYWWGELESNPTMEAEYILLTHFLGVADKERWRKVANHILSQQRPDGTWGQYYGAPGDLSTSTECYFALKLIGVSRDEPPHAQGQGIHSIQGRSSEHACFHQNLVGPFRTVGLEGCPGHAA